MLTAILPLRETVAACERRVIVDALACRLTRRETASALGISLRALYYKLRQHGLL